MKCKHKDGLMDCEYDGGSLGCLLMSCPWGKRREDDDCTVPRPPTTLEDDTPQPARSDVPSAEALEWMVEYIEFGINTNVHPDYTEWAQSVAAFLRAVKP